jgi:sugar lactone lactonase YvrE
MKRPFHLILLAVLSLALLSPNAHAWIRSPATTFATFPPGAANPEGITADPAGNIYASLFAVHGTSTNTGQVFVFGPNGKLLRRLDIAGSSTLLLGIEFRRTMNDLLVIDFGNAKVLSVDPHSGASSVFATVTGAAGLNALTFDKNGNVYISDSFQGIIWKTGPNGGAATPWVTDTTPPTLTTGGVPPFGANGLAFNKAQDALFVANTGNDTVVRIPVTGGTPGTPHVFVNSINGADGLVIDEHDNIWVCANQADEIVVVDPTGRAIAKLGDFDGIDPHGAPNGLLFPASLVFSGEFLYVTNLSLDLRLFNPDFNAVDSQWAAQVTTHTLAKIRARIPPVQGLPRP